MNENNALLELRDNLLRLEDERDGLQAALTYKTGDLVSPEAVFHPSWPRGIEQRKFYEVKCDDKGRLGGSWLRVLIADDGDVHVAMQEWEEIPEGTPDPLPSIRIRTYAGGGRNHRTHQALLWLALAIKLDAEDNGR